MLRSPSFCHGPYQFIDNSSFSGALSKCDSAIKVTDDSKVKVLGFGSGDKPEWGYVRLRALRDSELFALHGGVTDEKLVEW